MTSSIPQQYNKGFRPSSKKEEIEDLKVSFCLFSCMIRSALKEEQPHPGESQQPAVYVFVISELIRQTFALAFQDIHIPEATGTSLTYPHLILLAALGNSMHTAAASMFWSVMVQMYTPTLLSGTSPAFVFVHPQIPRGCL